MYFKVLSWLEEKLSKSERNFNKVTKFIIRVTKFELVYIFVLIFWIKFWHNFSATQLVT